MDDDSPMQHLRRVPHASHWGAYTLLVDGDRIVGAEPFRDDPAPSPIVHAVKGWADPARRVAQPMVRAGWLRRREASDRSARGREDFAPVSWDEAFDLVAGEIGRVRRDFGNASIFAGSYGWASCGRFHHASGALKRLLNLVGGYTGHVDTYSIAAGPVILRHALGSDAACNGRASTLDTIAKHTETLVVFGALSPRTAQSEAGGLGRHVLEGHLRRLAERGGVRIVLVSPLRDDLPDWVPAEWWPIRPNTDTALMLALAHEVIAAGRHDRDFLARCCSGTDAFLDYLAGRGGDGIVKDAAWAEGITGIPAAATRALAERLPATRTMLTVSWSLQRADHGEQPFWAALGLAAVLGQVGLPGGGVGYGYGSLGGVGAAIPLAAPPSMPQGTRPNRDFIPVARIADLLLRPGETFTYQGNTHVYPDTRLVYWAGGNPFHQDLNRLRRAWTRPETIIVQDPMWTATAKRADIVLPATTSLERNDLAGNRRSDYVLAMHKAIEPLGQSRPDWDIFRGLAARLGVEDAFTEGRSEMEWIRHLYEQTREDARQRHQHLMPDFDTFWHEGHARVPARTEHTYLAEFRDAPERRRLNTESGRIVLGSETLAKLGYDDCPPHPAWLPPAEWLGAADATAADQPRLHLLSHQPIGKLHSQLDDSPLSQSTKRDGREQLRLHPADAARLRIADGQAVRVWNARGQCLATAQIADSVRPGVAVLPTGSWYDPADDDDGNALERAGNPNVLTLDKGTSQFGQGCAAHTCLVQVEPY